MNNIKTAVKIIENSQEYNEFKTILDIIGDRWSIIIIISVFESPKRYKEIEKFTEGISPRTLSKKLNRLVEAGMLKRHDYKEFPPRIEYNATDKARELRYALKELKKWSKKYCN